MSVIVFIGIVLVFLETAVPQLLGTVELDKDNEDSSGISVMYYYCSNMRSHSYTPPRCIGQWCTRRLLSFGVLQSLFSGLLLEDFDIHLPCNATDNWNHAGIPDKECQVQRIERLKICCNHNLCF